MVQLIRALRARLGRPRGAHARFTAWTQTLTPGGRTILVAARRRVRAHDARVVSGLSDRERVTLVELLERVGAPAEATPS